MTQNITLSRGGSYNDVRNTTASNAAKKKFPITKDGVISFVKDVGERVFYQEALRNLNWSRGYLWKVKLADVPPPFHPEGIIKLPVIDVVDTLAMGTTFDWEAGIDFLQVPWKRQQFTINITMYDDEEGTLEMFFERWFNEVYNSRYGVLPLTEAIKDITIAKVNSMGSTLIERKYKVFPQGTLMGYNKLESGPRQYSIDLVIAKYINPIIGDTSSASQLKQRAWDRVMDYTGNLGLPFGRSNPYQS